jgi:beta-glucanase (GH16 family)
MRFFRDGLMLLCMAGCGSVGGAADDTTVESSAKSSVPLGPTAPAGHRWRLLFSDEFDDTSGMSGPNHGLESSKWNSGWFTSGVDATSPPVEPTEAEWYGPEGIVFPGDGSVHLRLTSNANSTYDKSYESGMITTHDLFTFSPSKARTVVEARLKVPGPNSKSGGYWPAFWLLSNEDGPGGTGQWPPEIDIFEFFGNSNTPVAHLHTTGTDISQELADSSGTKDLSLAFHTYTIDISTGQIAFYLDGTRQWTYTDTHYIANLLEFDPMYVLIYFAFGGDGGGDPTGKVPNDMSIDYVRSWQVQ